MSNTSHYQQKECNNLEVFALKNDLCVNRRRGGGGGAL